MKKIAPILIVAAAVIIAAIVALSQRGYRPIGAAHLLKIRDLTPAEIKFGRSPKRDRSVVYQPDVVVMENGTEATRSLTADGLGCVLKSDARGTGDLRVGKIAFVTNRCVGRIISAKREGDDLTLILAPVEITDIFSKLDITVNQPVELAQGINYAPPEVPGKTYPLDGNYPASFLQTVAYNDPPRAPGILPPIFKLKMQTSPLKNDDGVGMEFRGDKYGLRTVVQAQIRLNKPNLKFSLSIDKGNVESTVVLQNAAGFRLAFDSAVDEGGPRNITWYAPFGSLSFPIGGPVPFSLDFRQDLFLDVQFLSGSSSFSAGGVYDFNADIGFTYKNNQFTLVTPQGLTVQKAIMNNMTGVAIAPRRFAFRHTITATAGIGGAGFTIGPQLLLGTRIDVKEGGDTGIVQCKGSTLQMGVKGGVGWTVSPPIVEVINFFLNLLQRTPIRDHGGFHTEWKYWVNRKAEEGGNICGTSGG